MGLGERLRTAALYLLTGQKAVIGLDALIGAGGTISYPRTDFESLSKEGYEKNAIIYSCINELGSSASEPKLVVEVQNRKGEWEEKPEHRLARLLENPNPEMSGYDFLFGVTMFQSLAGNAFYEKERSKAGTPVALWPMRPDRVGIKTVKSQPGERVKQRIVGYTWRSGADVIDLRFKDVIHFKHPNPRDDLWGLPPLAAAAREGDTDNKATDYVRSFFDNAAVPRGIMKVAGHIDEAEELRIKDRLQKLYTGSTGWHDPLILGEGSEWIELAETFKDMDFPNLRQIGEARLCMVFQVPPILIAAYTGLEHMTYANYAEARTSFWQETLMPLYRKHADTLNRSLAWPDWGKDVRVRFDYTEVLALQEDRAEIWDRATKAFQAGAITREMFWQEIGLEPPEEGVFVLSPMLQEVGVGQPQKAIRISERKALVDAHEAQYKVFDAVARAWELRFKSAARELFGQELERILAILKREGKASKAGDPFAQFLMHVMAYLVTRSDAWTEMFLMLMGGLMANQVETVGGALGFAFDLAQPTVQAFLHEYTMKFAEGVVGVTEEGMRGLVATAQEEGWSVPHLREEITGLFDAYDKDRAEVIARTETIRSSNAGTMETWRLAGIERKQWYASLDGRQCPWCEAMHNRYGPGTDGIAMTQTFVNLGGEVEGTNEKTMIVTYEDVYHPPLHPQCRCTILAVVE